MRADKAIWPSQAANIVPACCIITELLFHLLERPRIVYPRDRISIGFHPLTVSVSARSVKGIPISDDSPSVAEWRKRMGEDAAKEIYKQRAATAECANAQARNRGLTAFAVRGLEKVKIVALWHALTHNMMCSWRLIEA